jgi:8-oxo-dGTP pyrophosphatase MutT (NUDIX family)
MATTPTLPTPKLLSLVFLLDSSQRRVLLGYKKRGFGAGRWTGFGGKMESGETMLECASRELHEESGLLVPCDKLERRGRLHFNMLSDGMVDKQSGAVSSRLHVSVFSTDLKSVASGEMAESEEMRPQWWKYDEVPLDEMWTDDKYWLPALLADQDVIGDFTFTDQTTIASHEVQVLPRGDFVKIDAEQGQQAGASRA